MPAPEHCQRANAQARHRQQSGQEEEATAPVWDARGLRGRAHRCQNLNEAFAPNVRGAL